MTEVFHLNIKIGSIKSDLYFESKETAERMVGLLNDVLTPKAKKQMKIEAYIHTVYSAETAMNELMGLFSNIPQ